MKRRIYIVEEVSVVGMHVGTFVKTFTDNFEALCYMCNRFKFLVREKHVDVATPPNPFGICTACSVTYSAPDEDERSVNLIITEAEVDF